MFAFTVLFGVVTHSRFVVAQAIFSRSTESVSATQADTTVVMNGRANYTGGPAKFSVSYFDSTVQQPTVEFLNIRNPYSRIDSLLAQVADSLFREVEKPETAGQKTIVSRAAERLPFVPAIPPLRFGTWQDYQISSQFGWRIHPIGGSARLHNGLDLPQPTGTPVFATADGVVASTGSQRDGLGLYVCIEHPTTGYLTIYGHLSTYLVRRGDKVRRGVLIGRVGNTGRSTGPHLHYTILYRGRPVDPARYCFLWVKLARTGWSQMGWVGATGPATLPARRQNGAK